MAQGEFDKAVQNNNCTLIFYSNQTVERKNYYADIAQKACGVLYKVFTINIDNVTLSEASIAAYQQGILVACCAILADGKVVYKKVEPDPVEFELSIKC
jgi:hypothetical protein